MYDYLVVGSGIYGAVWAHQCKENKKTCLVIDKRNHIAGNVYSEKIENIDVHKYGPHIFNTNNDQIWQYAQQFSKFIQYTHKVKVNYHNKIYSMPINLQTIYEIYGVKTPEEAKKQIESVKVPISNPKNLEEWCLSQIGPELYDIFIRHYTQKQWKRDPKELPISIIKRLPIRFNFDDRWHESKYSGIPSDGYTQWIANMLDGTQVELGVDYFERDWSKYAKKVVYTGPIDRLFNYCYGKLDYRTLRFESKTLTGDYQGVAQMNYTDEHIPFTRTVEHKHFTYKNSDKTVVTWEYPEEWKIDAEPYYPINDERNNQLYKKYKEKLDNCSNMVGGGRLCMFKYYDMDSVIASALHKFRLVYDG
jgi:UDP-galactopyranose mutase